MDNTIASYEDMKSNPVALLALVNKHVKVHLIKNKCFVGFVHSIDPVSYSIILSVPKGQSYQTLILPGHGIRNIEENTTENVTPPPRKSELDVTDTEQKKERVIAWLKKNLLTVTVDEDAVILEGVRILPPYKILDICTSNPNIFTQMRKILESMPDDFEL